MIKNAEFIISVADAEMLYQSGAPEIAIAGKSNVGKSSFINMITNHGKLAKTGKEPGRTRLLNYFKCNNGAFFLVDLPGYGYAEVSDAEKEKWGRLIEGYFQNSRYLKNVFLLLDIRRDPSADDLLLIRYLYHYQISFTVIATKTDKVTKNEAVRRRSAIASALGLGVQNIFLVSSLNKTGKADVFDRIDTVVYAEEETEEDGPEEEK